MIIDKGEIDKTVQLHRGKEEAAIWTRDFSYDFFRINAEY
jgi:N-acetylglutamate synthase/N-acetylornithine aminotransferase